MGTWWLGQAISNALAGQIATWTGIATEGDARQVIPLPLDTVHVYGSVFGKITIMAFVAALVCLILSPLLTHWMHSEAAPE